MTKLLFIQLAIILNSMLFIGCSKQNMENITPNQFEGSDIRRIQAAVDEAAKITGKVIIPSRNSNGSNVWKIDSAILLPSNITVILDNCTIQLSDSCRDNMFRSDNVGVGISDPIWNQNISIIGIGNVVLKGANNPRATGDANGPLALLPKKGTAESYGSDAGKKNAKHTSDWRSIMILIAYVDGFKLENIDIENAHSWAISFERTKNAKISNIDIYSPEFMEVGERLVKVDNRDGINLRQGCKNFIIDNVTGVSGDDFIALTSLDYPYYENGDVNSHQVTSMKWNGHEDNIERIYISNIKAQSQFRGVAIRANNEAKIQYIYINSLIYRGKYNALLVGGYWMGKSAKAGNINNIHASNIIGKGQELILIESPIFSSSFINGIYTGISDSVITYKIIEKNECKGLIEKNLIKITQY